MRTGEKYQQYSEHTIKKAEINSTSTRVFVLNKKIHPPRNYNLVVIADIEMYSYERHNRDRMEQMDMKAVRQSICSMKMHTKFANKMQLQYTSIYR